MFKVIGALMVCGFALYGLATYLQRRKTEEGRYAADSTPARPGGADAEASE